MNFQQQEQFYQMMTRLKSRAASTKEDAIVTEIVNGLIVSKPAKRIEYISEPAANPVLESKAATTQYQTVVKKYDMSLPSTGDQVYKCGLHDYETRSLTEFNRHVENHSTGSKAASVPVPVNKLQEILRFQRSNGRL